MLRWSRYILGGRRGREGGRDGPLYKALLKGGSGPTQAGRGGMEHCGACTEEIIQLVQFSLLKNRPPIKVRPQACATPHSYVIPRRGGGGGGVLFPSNLDTKTQGTTGCRPWAVASRV